MKIPARTPRSAIRQTPPAPSAKAASAAKAADDTADIVRQFTVRDDDAGVRLDRWFKRHLPGIGFATISRWARTGQIRIDGARADPADRLAVGQTIRVPPGGATPTTPGLRARPELTDAEVERAEAMVIAQDRAAIIINKPPGLATQGGSGTYDHVDKLLDAFVPAGDAKAPRPRLVHRLDKDTSGVLLVARTPGSAAFFSKRFSTRSARKIYWALVIGVPSLDEGQIDLPLAKQPGSGGEKMMVDESEHGQSARSRYRVLDRAGNRAAWVELSPLTGRTHQLRVHMAAIGHPIVGDGKYGGPEAFLSGSISRKMHLHARRLIIDHPDGTPLDVTAPLPEHFAASLMQLGFDESMGEAREEVPPPAREVKKAAGKAHAKQVRKERRGERRARDEAPVRKAPTKRKAVAKTPPAKSSARPKNDAARPGNDAARSPAKPARGGPKSPRLASKPARPGGGTPPPRRPR